MLPLASVHLRDTDCTDFDSSALEYRYMYRQDTLYTASCDQRWIHRHQNIPLHIYTQCAAWIPPDSTNADKVVQYSMEHSSLGILSSHLRSSDSLAQCPPRDTLGIGRQQISLLLHCIDLLDSLRIASHW